MCSIHVKYLMLFPECNQIWISVIFIKVSNIKFHRNPSSGCCADMCGQTEAGTYKADRYFLWLCYCTKKLVLRLV